MKSLQFLKNVAPWAYALVMVVLLSCAMTLNNEIIDVTVIIPLLILSSSLHMMSKPCGVSMF